jgi:hypothetical protein
MLEISRGTFEMGKESSPHGNASAEHGLREADRSDGGAGDRKGPDLEEAAFASGGESQGKTGADNPDRKQDRHGHGQFEGGQSERGYHGHGQLGDEEVGDQPNAGAKD